jgi:tRNA(Ile)-lysidine synthase
MINLFQNFIDKNSLFSGEDLILLGVSGGIDSRVMLHLFLEAGYNTAIAHCNFRLRGDEADADENFVHSLAEKNNIPFHRMHFNTSEYAKLQKISIQMAARELRYNWFENVRRSYGYNYIAVAHNADDAVETFFINLIRGTGIKGLTGIRPKNNYIVRPLLFATRQEIENYCNENNLQYRNDTSNFSDKYLRNNIRHNILHAFEHFPGFKQTMKENLEKLSDAEKIYNFGISILSEKVIKKAGDEWFVDIFELKKSGAERALLHEILQPFAFSAKTIDEIIKATDGETGAMFYSELYRLIKDRNRLIISSFKPDEAPKYYIDIEKGFINEPIALKFSIKSAGGFIIPVSKNIAAIDADKIIYPLILRRWQKGDYFQPLGMDNMKKISDFFIDNKFSIPEKENAWLLASGDQIAWIVSYRLDDRFKITSGTKNILMIETKESI